MTGFLWFLRRLYRVLGWFCKGLCGFLKGFYEVGFIQKNVCLQDDLGAMLAWICSISLLFCWS